MKPQVLDNIQIDFQWPEIAAKVEKELDKDDVYLGEIKPQSARNDDPLIAKLLDVGKEHGLVYRKQNFYPGSSYVFYPSSSYLPIRGSVPWHDDDGIGLLLNWLVASRDLHGYKDNLDYNKCHLLTKHGQLRVQVGDIFVFNGNIGHAWVSNSQCVLVQTRVSASRKKKQ